jgi:DNA-binding IclR family transcriptional regulator
MLIGRKRVHVEQTVSGGVVHVTVPIGARSDLVGSASGMAMLSRLEADERLAIIEHTSRSSSGGAVNVDLADDVQKIRRLGYAAHDNEEAGTSGVAASVVDQFGSVVGALSIITLSARMDAARMARYGLILKEEADRFSMQLGWRPAKAVEAREPSR